MTLEDFTGYTEVDPGSVLDVSSDTITATDLPGNATTTNVYKDKGAGGITDFEYQFKITCTDQSDAVSLFWIFAVANDVDFGRNETTTFGVVFSGTAAHAYLIRLYDRNTNNQDFYIRASATGTWYFTFTRVGNSATLKIYSDEARTTLLDTLTITCTEDAFRYLGFGHDGGAAAAIVFSGTLEDLDLMEEPATVSTAAATTILESSAQLNGSIDSMGNEDSVVVTFEYGETAAYGSETTGSTETETGSIAEVIDGLKSNTTYHFRIKAVGDFGTVYGDDATFTTLEETETTMGNLPRKIGSPSPILIGLGP